MKEFIKYQVNGRYVEIPADYAHLIQMKTKKEIAAEYRIPVALLKERRRDSNKCPINQAQKKCYRSPTSLKYISNWAGLSMADDLPVISSCFIQY
jgi:hypothetical protein